MQDSCDSIEEAKTLMTSKGNNKAVDVEDGFPFRLYDMLEDAEGKGFDDIISWHPR